MAKPKPPRAGLAAPVSMSRAMGDGRFVVDTAKVEAGKVTKAVTGPLAPYSGPSLLGALLARASGQVQPPKKRRGRPSKTAQIAAQTWAEVTEGAGTVLDAEGREIRPEGDEA